MNIPQHLQGDQASGAHEMEAVAQYEIGNLKNSVYLILDWKDKTAAIVDPQKNLGPLLEFLRRHKFLLDAVFLTHTHHDHVAGLPDLVHTFPNIRVIAHDAELHRLDGGLLAQANLNRVQDGDLVPVGQFHIQVLHTPGHSAGECCYLLDNSPQGLYLFTGDTIFIRDCGRTDLATGSTEDMFRSLQRIKALPPQTIILPGHHYQKECASTLKREVLESPPLKCASIAELAALP